MNHTWCTAQLTAGNTSLYLHQYKNTGIDTNMCVTIHAPCLQIINKSIKKPHNQVKGPSESSISFLTVTVRLGEVEKKNIQYFQPSSSPFNHLLLGGVSSQMWFLCTYQDISLLSPSECVTKTCKENQLRKEPISFGLSLAPSSLVWSHLIYLCEQLYLLPL